MMSQPVTHTPTTTRTVAEILIGSIEDARQNKSDVMLTTPSGQSIGIFDNFTHFVMPGSSDWLARPANDTHSSISCTPTHQHNDVGHRPIDELMWTLGYYSSHDTLIHGCRRDDVISLTRWPNYTRLPHNPYFHRISALLTARPTSVVLASRLLNIPEQEIYRFYNAAQSAGYIKAVNRQEDNISTRKHKHQSFMKRLFERLTGPS